MAGTTAAPGSRKWVAAYWRGGAVIVGLLLVVCTLFIALVARHSANSTGACVNTQLGAGGKTTQANQQALLDYFHADIAQSREQLEDLTQLSDPDPAVRKAAFAALLSSEHLRIGQKQEAIATAEAVLRYRKAHPYGTC